jgi:serine/threonine protein kinase/tetratricopeptide (TPR) repeat protein
VVGQTLSHYHILEQIGAGGMGVVYRAHDERLDRDVALKVLPPGILADRGRKRFRQEALALSRLNHPNIETVFDFDTQDGVDFLVMEHIAGVTLDHKLVEGALPERVISRLGIQLADGLAAAHQQGVVHCDLKPGNLIVTDDGRLKILDFGLAKLLHPVTENAVTTTLTETQAATGGTLPYMPPEQLRIEKIDARSDIWAAGTVLYEMATGRRAFPERVASKLTDAILHGVPESPRTVNAKVSPELERIILKCLDKDPENRYQSARELSVDLRRLSVPTARSAPLAHRQVPARAALVISVGVLMLLLAILAGLNVSGWRERLVNKAGPPRITSLAVLPLENLSHDPEQDYFTDGMTEAIITDLANISSLKVISRTSVMQYKGTKKPLPAIARELGVDGVVEGSVLREGQQVRIAVQLIHGPSDRHLWAQSFDRELNGILALQREVARTIAEEIRIKLTPQERAQLTSTRPVNPAAHEAYLKGRYFWNKRTREGLQKGIEYFQQAIEEDPTFALAHVGLADSYAVLSVQGFLRTREGYPRARAEATKALEIDDNLAEPHADLAWVKMAFDLDWAGAEREFQRTLELNPNLANGYHWYGLYLVYMGRFDEGLTEIKRARELDPLAPQINTNLAGAYYNSRQYDQALQEIRNTLEIFPNYAQARYNLGFIYIQKGLYEEAISQFQQAIALEGSRHPRYLAALGHAYGAAGRKGAAQTILKELLGQEGVDPCQIVSVYLGLGQKEKALDWLGKAYEDRGNCLYILKVSPSADPLRSDPRFQDLLHRIGLPP